MNSFCGECGTQLPNNAKFCIDCGAPRGQSVQPSIDIRPRFPLKGMALLMVLAIGVASIWLFTSTDTETDKAPGLLASSRNQEPPTAANLELIAADPELASAKAEFDKAFDLYTTLATKPDSAGDREAALTAYREASSKYEAIKAKASPASVDKQESQTSQLDVSGISGIETISSSPVSTLKDGRLALEEAVVEFTNTRLGVGEASMRKIEPTDGESESGLASKLYLLELDKEVAGPVTVSLPLKRNDGGQVMLGIGASYLDNIGGKTFSLYRYVEASVSGNTATASFTPADFADAIVKLAGGPVTQPVDVRYSKLGFFTRTFFYKSGSSRFSLTHPRDLGESGSDFLSEKDLDLLFSDLNQVYAMFEGDLGYSYSKRKVYPIEVHIADLKGLDGAFDLMLNIDHASITINSELFKKGYANNRTKIRSIFIHEFFHFVQSNYTSYASWLDEATSTYFEWKETKGSLTLDALTKTWFNTYTGVFPEKDDAADGYARMPLIQFLAERVGEDFIKKVYESKPKTHADWNKAISEATRLEPQVYAGDFYESYLLQKVQSNYTAGWIYSSLVYGSGLVEEVKKVAETFNVVVPDPDDIKDEIAAKELVPLGSRGVSIEAYGARLLALSVSMPADKSDMADDASLRISCDGNVDVRIIELTKRGNVETTLVGSEIDSIKNKYGRGYTHLILVTALHEQGKQDYTVKVAFFGGEDQKGKKIKRLTAQFKAETDPTTSPLTFLRNSFAKAGSLNLTYHDDTNFTIEVPAMTGSLNNGYETERYAFPATTLTGVITPGKLDKHGSIGSLKGQYRVTSTTTDQRGRKTSITYTVKLIGSISPNAPGNLTLGLQAKYRYDYADPDIRDGNAERSQSLGFSFQWSVTNSSLINPISLKKP